MCAYDGHEGGKFGGNGLRSDANDRHILPPLPRSMIRASFFGWRRHGSFMHHTAGVFVSAVLAAFLIGMASAGAADEPVATAPIPPPLPTEPPSPDTPMMIPADLAFQPEFAGNENRTRPARRRACPRRSKEPQPTGQSRDPGEVPQTAEHARRSKGPVSQHTTTRYTRRRNLAAEKAGAAKTAAVAAAAEAAEKDTARRRAAERGHEGYRGAWRAQPEALPAPATGGAPPNGDMTYGNRISGNRSYNGGTYPDRSPPPPPEADGRRPRYDAEYPRPPMFYGPAYPPPWFNAAAARIPYPDRWGRGPMPPW